MTPRLLEKYQNEIVPAMKEQFGRGNLLSLPRLQKIIISMGGGTAVTEKKHLETAVEALTEIAGQKPVVTLARKSIAGFRLRDGMAIRDRFTLSAPDWVDEDDGPLWYRFGYMALVTGGEEERQQQGDLAVDLRGRARALLAGHAQREHVRRGWRCRIAAGATPSAGQRGGLAPLSTPRLLIQSTNVTPENQGVEF